MTNLANQRKRYALTRSEKGTAAAIEALRKAETFNCDVCGEDKPVNEKHHGYPYGLETAWCDACGESSLVKNKTVEIEQRMFWCPTGKHFISAPWSASTFQNKITFTCPDCGAQYLGEMS